MPTLLKRPILVKRHIVPLLLGIVAVTGFAPFGLFPVPVLTLALLFSRWRDATSSRDAAMEGFAYGAGFFLAGVSWVYVSLHDFGAMPAPVAVAVTILFCAILSAYPAIAGGLAHRWFRHSAWFPFSAAALWVLTEWTRGWLFTGFPWLAAGYSQIPWSPLAGWAPVAGIHGVGLLVAFAAGLLAVALRRNPTPGTRLRVASVVGIVTLFGSGWMLQRVEWSQPSGAPVSIALVQGNIPQDMKWQPGRLSRTLDNYLALVRSSNAQLIVLPETALPLFLDDVPPRYLEALKQHVASAQGDILIGVPERDGTSGYFNSVVSVGASPTQYYRKAHLVPFGEFIPLRPLLAGIVGAMAIPLQDFSRGGPDQQPMAVAGTRVAVNICYEDAFGEEIRTQLPAAALLVNVSNVAWFGRSIAPPQHLQISQARALETGRYMVRATNTGMTAVINPQGIVEHLAEPYTTAVLTASVQGYEGATPYVRAGNAPVLLLSLALIAVPLLLARRRT
jgi:apolipoprotein N-acyltransferase